MPPIVALIICTIFVFWLLRLERKQATDVSLMSWLPNIWLLLIAGKSLAEWFGIGGSSMEAGSPLDRAFIIALVIIGCVILTKRSFNLTITIKENIWVILLLGYMLVSILWSDMPYTSLKRWVREALTPVIMAMVILSEQNPIRTVESIFRRSIYILIPISLMLIKYYPHLGVEFGHWSGALMWIGVGMQKNGLGELCLFSSFFLIWSVIKRRKGLSTSGTRVQTRIELLLLLMTVWLFMGPKHTLTYSATSLVALIVVLVSFIGLLKLKKRNIIISKKVLTIFIVTIIVYGSIIPFAGGLLFYNPADALNREDTLTGRTDIWAYLVPYALQKPILGHGFGGFWTDAMRAATSSHAHNGYLDVILNTGFTGLFFWSMFLISNCRRAQRLMTKGFDWGILWFCLLLMAVVHNIAESSVISFTGLLPAALLFMLITSPTVDSKQAEFKNRNSRILEIKAPKNY